MYENEENFTTKYKTKLVISLKINNKHTIRRMYKQLKKEITVGETA